ncbi:hypothetical protein GGF31_002704 [Allomyces arbusculus]|nr:hypothetical protein GGF31_002704 [Allomyces arbusculus]
MASPAAPKPGAPAAAAASSASSDAPVHPSKVSLTLLLVSGDRRAGWLFDATTTVKGVKAAVLAAWPSEWPGDRPTHVSQLRLLHLGKFLDDNTTLQESHIAPGETTVVHLLVGPPDPKRVRDDEAAAAKASGLAGAGSATSDDNDPRRQRDVAVMAGCFAACIIM